MIDLGKVRPGSTLRIPFGSFAAATGAPSAVTNFADADIQVYKDGGTTQRASAAALTATTTFDALTGINMVTIDLADNTTADFWAAGSEYIVVVSDITVDGQTLRFPIARFRIGIHGEVFATTIATLASQTSFTLAAGSANDSAYIGCIAYIHDAASAVQCCFGTVSAYTGATKTVTLAADPAIFTMAAKDNIALMPPVNARAIGGVVQTGRDLGASVLLSPGTGTGQVDLTSGVAKSNMVQMGGDAQSGADLKDFADAGYDPATNTVLLVDTLTTYTGNTPQTGDSYDQITHDEWGLNALLARFNFGVEVTNLTPDAVNAIWAKTLTELAAVPDADAEILDALCFLFMAVRNKRTTNSALGEDKIHNDAGTVVATAAISDASNIFTKNEYV